MKTLYLTSAVGAWLLLGCSGAESSETNPQQAGKSGTAGAKPLFGGFAGSTSPTSVAGASGQGGAALGGGGTGGASTGGAGTGGGAGRAGAGGSPVEAGLPPGFPTGGGGSIGFGGAGFLSIGGASTVIRIDTSAGAGGTSGIRIGGSSAGRAGTGIWISF
ncbi:MAG TPA: hypothetical protein VEQ59_12035 [Polyangiaceae bacterium]|nr:hypothetical protein [Polyangiaceae bacterium]